MRWLLTVYYTHNILSSLHSRIGVAEKVDEPTEVIGANRTAAMRMDVHLQKMVRPMWGGG